MEEIPAVEDAGGISSGDEIGRQVQSQGSLEYVFYALKLDDGYELHLQVKNSGPAPVDLRYASSELWDFGVFDGQSLLWNYNMNRSFMQAMKVDVLGPGESRDFHAPWNGRTRRRGYAARELSPPGHPRPPGFAGEGGIHGKPLGEGSYDPNSNDGCCLHRWRPALLHECRGYPRLCSAYCWREG
jgi:hypothetical protein